MLPLLFSSPAPHQPCPQTKDTHTPELLSCSESDPLEGLLDSCDKNESQHKDESSLTVVQKNNHLEAVVEDCGPGEASFFLGDSPRESLILPEQNQPRSCLIETPVEVHSPMGSGFEEERVVVSQTEEKNDQEEKSLTEANLEKVNCDAEKDVSSDVSDVKDSDAEHQEAVITEETVLEKQNDAEEESKDFEGLDEGKSEESESKLEPETQEEPPEEMDHEEEKLEEENVETKDESDEENHSLPSSNGSIVKVSDEESVCDEAEEANGFMKTLPENWPEEEHILELHINGCQEEKEEISRQELQFTSDVSDFSKSVDLHSAVTGGDVTENSDFSVIETSCSPVLAESKYAEQEEQEELEEAREVEVHQLDS